MYCIYCKTFLFVNKYSKYEKLTLLTISYRHMEKILLHEKCLYCNGPILTSYRKNVYPTAATNFVTANLS